MLTIGRTCLTFLEFVESLYTNAALVKAGGAIRVERKIAKIKTNRGYIDRSYLHHHSFPEPDAGRERLPISRDTIDRLIAANQDISPTPYIRRRRYVMLRLFEITGARRIEVANIKVKDIYEAMLTGELMVFTAKQRGTTQTRKLPVAVEI